MAYPQWNGHPHPNGGGNYPSYLNTPAHTPTPPTGSYYYPQQHDIGGGMYGSGVYAPGAAPPLAMNTTLTTSMTSSSNAYSSYSTPNSGWPPGYIPPTSDAPAYPYSQPNYAVSTANPYDNSAIYSSAHPTPAPTAYTSTQSSSYPSTLQYGYGSAPPTPSYYAGSSFSDPHTSTLVSSSHAVTHGSQTPSSLPQHASPVYSTTTIAMPSIDEAALKAEVEAKVRAEMQAKVAAEVAQAEARIRAEAEAARASELAKQQAAAQSKIEQLEQARRQEEEARKAAQIAAEQERKRAADLAAAQQEAQARAQRALAEKAALESQALAKQQAEEQAARKAKAEQEAKEAQARRLLEEQEAFLSQKSEQLHKEAERRRLEAEAADAARKRDAEAAEIIRKREVEAAEAARLAELKQREEESRRQQLAFKLREAQLMAKESELAEAEIRKREQLLAEEKAAKERIERERIEAEDRAKASIEREATRRKLEVEAELAARENELSARAAAMQEQINALQQQLSSLSSQEDEQRRRLDAEKLLLEQSRQLAVDEQAKQQARVAAEEQKMKEITQKSQEMERRLAQAQQMQPTSAPRPPLPSKPSSSNVASPPQSSAHSFVHEERPDPKAKGRLRVEIIEARNIRSTSKEGSDSYAVVERRGLFDKKSVQRVVGTPVVSKSINPVWRALVVLNVFDPSEEEVVIRISQKWKFSTEFLGCKSFPVGYFENSYDRASAQQWFKLEPDASKSSDPIQGEIRLIFEYQSLENKPVVSGPTDFQHKAHIGWSAGTGFDIRNLPPEWKEIFKAAGIKPAELKDPETAKLVIDTIVETIIPDSSGSELEAPPPIPPPEKQMQIPPTLQPLEAPASAKVPPPRPSSKPPGSNSSPPPPPPRPTTAAPSLPSSIIIQTEELPPPEDDFVVVSPRAVPEAVPTISIPEISSSSAETKAVALEIEAPVAPPPPPALPPPPPKRPSPTTSQAPKPVITVPSNNRNALLDQIRSGTQLKEVKPNEALPSLKTLTSEESREQEPTSGWPRAKS
eukprot:TRINITY_DN970_c0_g1_i2.p1 TRINITY_DN970_c0_g1~~TRINITY_DN970_c0_g1_i2.p1  ORF type:complete len:1029 (+),score=207.70 TRINITY_DN970_c0_g1_i2:226-3312(+)